MVGMETPLTTTHAGALPARLLHPDEVAHVLGRSKDWIYDEVEAGRLPARRIGRFLRFHPNDLVAWLDSHRTMSSDPSGARTGAAHESRE